MSHGHPHCPCPALTCLLRFIRLKRTLLSLPVLQHHFNLLGSWSGQKERADSASARSCGPCTLGRTPVQPSVSKTPNLITPASVPSIRIISRGADHPESYGAAAQLGNIGRPGADKDALRPWRPHIQLSLVQCVLRRSSVTIPHRKVRFRWKNRKNCAKPFQKGRTGGIVQSAISR
jgi:hypothetical protein